MASHPLDEIPPTQAQYVRNNEKSIKIGKVVYWGLLILGIVWVVIVTRFVFFPAPAASFLRAEILTPFVKPNGDSVSARSMGSVRMRAIVESPWDPDCLVGTQYYIEFADRTLAKLPGMRISTDGALKEALYEAAVPVDAPKGQAKFYIRDTYNCGISAVRVESPHVWFNIMEAKEHVESAKQGQRAKGDKRPTLSHPL